MSNRAQPALASKAAPPRPDPHVVWFGASRRLIAGQPDSHYGWMDTDDGPCIVKALDLELTAYSSTLLSHERAVLTRLRACHAPVPDLVNLHRPDWLVTRFAGLSLQLLELRAKDDALEQPALRLPFVERLAAWVHLLQRAQSMADQGVLAIDIYASNLVLPMTGGTSGQLRLHEAVLIDHAHTVVAGLNMRRPIWLDRDMARIPPELRDALRKDQEALMADFARLGAALPGHEAGANVERTRQAWASYDKPQQVQLLLDSGGLSRDAAMQFAVGVELKRIQSAAPASIRAELASVIAKMTSPMPQSRYERLENAAAALTALLPALPLVSAHHYRRVDPSELHRSPDPTTSAPPEFSQQWPPARPTTHAGPTLRPDSLRHAGPPMRRKSPSRARIPLSWLVTAAAVGAAVGAGLALPW